jgi:hypothetical protein
VNHIIRLEMRVGYLLIVTLVFQAAVAVPGDSVIFSVFPRVGSLNGGTELTVLGANFQRENISGV